MHFAQVYVVCTFRTFSYVLDAEHVKGTDFITVPQRVLLQNGVSEGSEISCHIFGYWIAVSILPDDVKALPNRDDGFHAIEVHYCCPDLTFASLTVIERLFLKGTRCYFE